MAGGNAGRCCGAAARKGRHIDSPAFSTSRGRPWSWITGRPRLTDAVAVLITFAAGALGLLGTEYRRSVIAALLFLITFQASIHFWRRSDPVVVLLVSTVISIIVFAITPDREPGTPALIFAVYAVSVYGPNRVRIFVAAAAIALLVGAVALLLLSDFETARKLLPAGATSLVAWVIGDYIRSRRQFLADLVERHRRERESAADEERLRIARELHDVVAHNVSLIAIQAGAARVSGNQGATALQSIETTARDTLAELNRLLGVLRKDPNGATRDPQPSLSGVDALLKPARDAGLDVTLKVSGEQRPLPAALDLTAYRIVQEALTNVMKHAHATRAEVLIHYEPDAVTLTVTDNGQGSSTAVGASRGHGLIGMRERVDLFGGDVNTASSSLGGFTVRATLPVKT